MLKKPNYKLISIIIPVYNEEKNIAQVISHIKKTKGFKYELIVVDDGSTDRTRPILKKNRSKIDQLIFKITNEGKGAAIKQGLLRAKGDIVIIQDADGEYQPENYHRLLSPILADYADVVYGSRFIGGEPRRIIYFWHYVANWWLTFLTNICTNLNLSDMETGAKVFRRHLIKPVTLQEKGFGFEPEITIKLAQAKARFYEVGISYYGRSYLEGKKITLWDGVIAFWIIIKYSLWAPLK